MPYTSLKHLAFSVRLCLNASIVKIKRIWHKQRTIWVYWHSVSKLHDSERSTIKLLLSAAISTSCESSSVVCGCVQTLVRMHFYYFNTNNTKHC